MSGKDNPGTIGNQFGLRYGILYYRALNTPHRRYPLGHLDAPPSGPPRPRKPRRPTSSFLLMRGVDEYFSDRRSNNLGLAVYATMLGQFLLGLESSVTVGFLHR